MGHYNSMGREVGAIQCFLILKYFFKILFFISTYQNKLKIIKN